VNVHPRKIEVKFVDGQKIFSVVLQQISALLGEQKVIASMHRFFG
jgi:DNA mismatch repair ATPase MutL